MTESTMRSVLKSKVAEELPEFEPGVKIPPEFQYRIESTGALLTIYNSMEMLLRYCNSLPGDKFFVPTPEYWVAEGPNGFASELRMPQNVRKDCQVLRGALQSSATLAKREVAFRMMKLLHALGEVDDQLRSVHVSLDPNTGKTVRLPSLKPLFMHVQVRKHHVTVPSHFQGRWEANIPLFVNVIRLWNENFNKTLHVGFLTSKKITLATKPFEIFMDTVPFQVEIKSSVESLYFEPRHLEYLKVFHLEFFKSVLRSKLEETLKWATLCVPLIDDIHFEEDLVPAYIIDWEAIEFAGTVDQTDLSIFEKGKAPLEKVSDIVVFDKRRYARSHFILELLPDKNPTNIIEPAMAKKYTSVEHVYRKRLQYSGPMDLDQFVIRAQPIGYPYRCKIRESNLEEAILVPELCIVNPVKSKHLQHARKYPLLLQYIEHRLLMEDLITGAKFPNAEFGFDADINLMQVAFTAPAAQLQYDYERLELFGDSFLKTHLSLHMFVMNPFRHEGFLTQGRAEMENNKNLRKHANKYDMEGFILADTLIRKTYIPPTLDSTPQQEISDKGVADVVEASIAACFLSNGEVSASNCIKFFLGDEMKPNWNSYYLHWCSHTLPQNLLEPSMITSCKLVEKRIGYKFHNVSLLAEALTHASALNGVNSYERLEFLGFIVTQFVFALEPKLSPGKMSELRTELYHNQFLAAVSAKLGLAKFMSHMSVALGKVHENWITAFQQKLKETDEKILTDDASILMFWNEMETAPKTLGDLYEALLGAVFLDSGFKMEPVQKIIKSTLIDVWWPRFEPLMNGSEGLFVQQPPRLITNIVTQNQCSQFIVKTHPQLTGSYLCEYVFHDTIIASVCLETKKESKKMAALEALKYLESNPNCFKEICSCVKVVEEEHEDSDHDDDE